MALINCTRALHPSIRFLLLILGNSLLFASPPLVILSIDALFLLLFFCTTARDGSLCITLRLREFTNDLLFCTILMVLVFLAGTKYTVSELTQYVHSTGLYYLKLLSSLILARLFYASMTSTNLRSGIHDLLFFLPKKIGNSIALYAFLCFNLIYSLEASWRASFEAAHLRGARPRTMKRLIFFYSTILISFLRASMLGTIQSAQALTLRAYTMQKNRGQKLRPTDLITLAIFILALIFVLFKSPLL